MYAERFILETDQSGNLKHVPKLPPNKQVEMIFRVLDDVRGDRLRSPHRDVAGKVRVIGDIVSTVPQNDWDLPG